MTTVFSFFCQDPVRSMEYFQELLGWDEIKASRSPIYRALQSGESTLGFHAPKAYELLGLSALDSTDPSAAVTAYPTIVIDTPSELDGLADAAADLGGRVIKAPFATYYGQWQVVLAAPEGHVFRLTCETLPEGMSAPALAL